MSAVEADAHRGGADDKAAVDHADPQTVSAVDEKEIAGTQVAGDVARDSDDDGHVLHREYPTDEEMVTLRRVADKIPWSTLSIAFVELCERFSYYGTTIVCRFSL